MYTKKHSILKNIHTSNICNNLKLKITTVSISSQIIKYGKEMKMNELHGKAKTQVNLTMLSERIHNPVTPFKNPPPYPFHVKFKNRPN